MLDGHVTVRDGFGNVVFCKRVQDGIWFRVWRFVEKSVENFWKCEIRVGICYGIGMWKTLWESGVGVFLYK